MTQFLVTCARWRGSPDTHTGLTHLGGADWILAKDDVIGAIDSGAHGFHVVVSGQPVEVAVVTGAIDRYLRARADGFWTDDLLRLPQCPDS